MLSVQRHVLESNASVSKIRALIKAELIKAGVRPSGAFDCLVAVTEACAKALRHKQDSPVDKPPRIGWKISAEAASFYVDDFSGHDWEMDIPTIDLDNPLAELGIDDFGVAALRKLMDEVSFEKTEDETQTVVVLSKRFR